MTKHRKTDTKGRSQYGLVTATQLSQAGMSRQERRTLIKNGLFLPVDHDVFRLAGAPLGWEQDMVKACLAAGPDAVASHRGAARIWDLVDPPTPIELTVPYEQRPLPVAAIRHRSNGLRPKDRAVRRKIPVTTPARTMLDLGAVAPELVPDALERCLYQRFLTTAALWRILDELGGRGRRGTRPLREALQNRPLGNAVPHSLLDPLLADIAATIGVRFEYQFKVTTEGHNYYLDFALPELLLGYETDGLSAHGTRGALDNDLERQNRLLRHGWILQRYTHTHLKRQRAAVRAEIVAMIERRRQDLHLL